MPWKAVKVNGEAIIEADKETGAVPGRLLRHGGRPRLEGAIRTAPGFTD